MLFHPFTLDLLLRFKKGKDSIPEVALLILILDNTIHFNIDYIFEILYKFRKSASKKHLISLIQENFVKVNLGNKTVCLAIKISEEINKLISEKRKSISKEFLGQGKNFIDSLREYQINDSNKDDSFSLEITKILEKINTKEALEAKETVVAQKNLLNIHDLSSNLDTTLSEIILNKNKIYDSLGKEINHKKIKKEPLNIDSPAKLNTLNFVKTVVERPEAVSKFTPLELKNATFIYDRNNIILSTQRRRDDLVNPVKLQFIKLEDQRKPPIYQKKDSNVVSKYSYEKLKEVISYEYDSSEEWEDEEDAINCSSISESTTSINESMDEEWIEKDSSEEEIIPQRNAKKPSFIFPEIKVQYFLNKEIFKCVTLVEANSIPESLEKIVLEEYQNIQDLNKLSKLFNITEKSISDFLSQKTISE